MIRILRTLILSALLVQALTACNLPVATTTSASGMVGTSTAQTGSVPAAPSATNNLPAVATLPATAPATVSPYTPTPPHIQIVSAQATALTGTKEYVSAVCPSGSNLIGGGFTSSPDMTILISAISESPAYGWAVEVQNNGASQQPFAAYAVCLFDTSVTTHVVQSSNPVNPGSNTSPLVPCPSGSIATGGGFWASPGMVVYGQAAEGINSANMNAWVVSATASSQGKLTVYASCLSGPSVTSTGYSSTINIPSSSIQSSTLDCPAGSILSSGGYALGPNSKVVVQSSFPTGSGWETQFQNNDSSSEKVDAMVICTAYPGP